MSTDIEPTLKVTRSGAKKTLVLRPRRAKPKQLVTLVLTNLFADLLTTRRPRRSRRIRRWTSKRACSWRSRLRACKGRPSPLQIGSNSFRPPTMLRKHRAKGFPWQARAWTWERARWDNSLARNPGTAGSVIRKSYTVNLIRIISDIIKN